MKKSEIRAILIEELEKVMAALGAIAPPYTDEMQPVGDLPNFDSLLSEDTTADIFIRLGLGPDADINPFYIKNKRACSLSEIVETLHGLVVKAKA